MVRFTIRDVLLATTLLSVVLAWFVNFPLVAAAVVTYCDQLGEQLDAIAAPAMSRSQLPPE